MTTYALSPGWNPRAFADKALNASGALWFLTAVVGQCVFAAYIAAFYWAPTLQGHFAAWNRKDLIKGYVPHDTAGNLFFAVHVMIAALITTSGALQLVPSIRARAPAFHRWNGRFYITAAFLMALGGLWMIWIRGTRLGMTGAFASSLLAVLIMVCAGLTLRYAVARRFDIHHRWALRTFMVANGVWFQRLGYGAWITLNHGPVGVGDHMDGPFDLFLAFACYLAPLAGLELYLRTRDGAGTIGTLAMTGLVAGLAALTGIGTFGAYMMMWRPFLTGA